MKLEVGRVAWRLRSLCPDTGTCYDPGGRLASGPGSCVGGGAGGASAGRVGSASEAAARAEVRAVGWAGAD